MSRGLCELSIVELSALIQSKQVSPVEVTAEVVERIRERNLCLNAFVTVTAELAEEQARAAEQEILRGNYRGPLHGVPVAVKDMMYTRGVRTTAGSKILAEFVPDSDATVVARLRQAGAVLVGKTALHEFAYGITNDNPHYGPTRNPWNRERSSGGSSGGSGVAVAAGMSFAALGTDTGGSIRIPASFCGVAGLKPTFGRVSLHGILPLGYTLDHAGPLARTVEDVSLVYQAIAGFDPNDKYSADCSVGEIRLHTLFPNVSLPGRGRESVVRVGVPKDYFFDSLQPDVERLVRQAIRVLEKLGARVIPVEFPGMADLTAASRTSLLVEAAAVHRKNLETHSGDFGADVKTLLEKGREVSAAEYVDAQLTRRRFSRQFERLFQQVDLLVTPATPLTAFPVGETKVVFGEKGKEREEDTRAAATRLLRAFNASGHPALSVCCGFDGHELPVGLQIVGRLFEEAAVLQCGHAYEQATDWHQRKPPKP
ncbi:MAG: amidase [Acidobacteria bacterium]|nr:amidase [Acidobacteriota bacterium]